MEKRQITCRRVDIKLSPTRNGTNSGESTSCVSKLGDARRQNLLALVWKDQPILSLLQQDSPLVSLGGKCLFIV